VLYLMRHGHTGLNALHEIHGRIDDPLDELGQEQAAALGHCFTGASLIAVYASPLQRAVQTAEPVAAANALAVQPDPTLMDRDYGPWSGHLKVEVEERFGSVDAAPGVEPWEAFSERVTVAFLALARRHQDQRVAVVAHDAVNQAVLWRLQPGRWEGPHRIPQRNGCWNRLEPADPGWAATVVDAVPGDGTAP
jgi:probable phosphoglycerate mutase